VPVLANMTEFGKGELHTTEQLLGAGVRLVIWPVTLLRLAMGEAGRGLDEIAATGTQARLLDRMQHRADLYDLVDYEGYSAFDGGVFDFTVER
jgi:methylisocitrate lyase